MLVVLGKTRKMQGFHSFNSYLPSAPWAVVGDHVDRWGRTEKARTPEPLNFPHTNHSSRLFSTLAEMSAIPTCIYLATRPHRTNPFPTNTNSPQQQTPYQPPPPQSICPLPHTNSTLRPIPPGPFPLTTSPLSTSPFTTSISPKLCLPPPRPRVTSHSPPPPASPPPDK